MAARQGVTRQREFKRVLDRRDADHRRGPGTRRGLRQRAARRLPATARSCRSRRAMTLKAADIAIVRGHADSIALRLANHDRQGARALPAAGQEARAVFEAVEQARVEAIGAMPCPAWQPISPPCWTTATARQGCRRATPTATTRRSRTPWRCMVREKPDRRSRRRRRPRTMVDLWRPGSRTRPARNSPISTDSIRRPGGLRAHVARHHRGPRHGRRAGRRPRPVGRERRRRRGRATSPASARNRPRARTQESSAAVDGGAAGLRGRDRSRRDGRPADGRRRAARRPGGRGRDRRARSPGGRNCPSRRCPTRTSTRSSPTSSTRRSRPRSSATPRSSTRLRAYLDKQLAQSAGRGGAARQPAAAPADGAAEPLLGVRPRGRHARRRAPARVVIDPMHPLSFKASRTPSSATRW